MTTGYAAQDAQKEQLAEMFKNAPPGSPFRPLRDDERAMMQDLVNEYYARFSGIVREARHLNDESKFKTATDGRVFSGEQAKAMGLVDQTGTLEDAVALAKELDCPLVTTDDRIPIQRLPATVIHA